MWSGTERGSMSKKDKEKYKQSLPPEVLKDMQIGGKTSSPVGDAAMLGLTFAGAKAAAAALPAIGNAGKGLLKNEVAKMTISDAAFKKGLLPELTKGGIKNWQHLRPWKAFTPQMLKTGPTPAAAAGTALMIEGAGAPAAIAGGPRLPGESGADPGMGSMSREEVLRWMKDNPGGAKKMWEKWNKLHGGVKLPPV